jgi:UDP-GlcNAc:undecaprenyl-phosphate GlcNAc-1-phosphate transferase
MAFAIGAWDDLREMKPSAKGGLTALLALLAPLVFGVTSIGPFLLLAASCWICLHAFNIVDNMDGVALGTGALSFTGLALITGHPLAWSAAGATAGVILWNLPPARLFLGDSGSLLLGMWSWGWGAGAGFWMKEAGGGTEILVLLWALPLLDLVFVSTTRLLSGRRPWVGGRDHMTHRMARAFGTSNRALTVWLALHLVLVAVAVIACRA